MRIRQDSHASATRKGRQADGQKTPAVAEFARIQRELSFYKLTYALPMFSKTFAARKATYWLPYSSSLAKATDAFPRSRHFSDWSQYFAVA